MAVTVGPATILVNDLDESSRFYRGAFGFDVLFDGELESGARTLHLGCARNGDASLWLLLGSREVGHPVVSVQTIGEPHLVLFLDDLQEAVGRLQSMGVSVVKPIVDAGVGFSRVIDNSGNEIVLVDCRRSPASLGVLPLES